MEEAGNKNLTQSGHNLVHAVTYHMMQISQQEFPGAALCQGFTNPAFNDTGLGVQE